MRSCTCQPFYLEYKKPLLDFNGTKILRKSLTVLETENLGIFAYEFECRFLIKSDWQCTYLFPLIHFCSAIVTLRNLGVKWLSEAMITRRVSMFILVTYPQPIRMIDWCLPLKAKMISYFWQDLLKKLRQVME